MKLICFGYMVFSFEYHGCISSKEMFKELLVRWVFILFQSSSLLLIFSRKYLIPSFPFSLVYCLSVVVFLFMRINEWTGNQWGFFFMSNWTCLQLDVFINSLSENANADFYSPPSSASRLRVQHVESPPPSARTLSFCHSVSLYLYLFFSMLAHVHNLPISRSCSSSESPMSMGASLSIFVDAVAVSGILSFPVHIPFRGI